MRIVLGRNPRPCPSRRRAVDFNRPAPAARVLASPQQEVHRCAQTAKIAVKGLKINTLIPPALLPADLVPPEPQPAGNPAVELELEGGALWCGRP